MKEITEFDLLIIEDDELSALLYKTQLGKIDKVNYNCTVCKDLKSGFDELFSKHFDAILLDLSLPDSDYEETISSIEPLSRVAPVLVTTMKKDQDLAMRALHLGAQDFKSKDEIDFCALSRDILYAKERFVLKRKLLEQQDLNDSLLRNMLPASLIEEMKTKGYSKPRKHKAATVLFTDFIGFTNSSMMVPPGLLVHELDIYFREFDKIITKYGIEKIKTIGDSYMCASGLPEDDDEHAFKIVQAAQDMMRFVELRKMESPTDPLRWEIRMGIHSGPVIAGIVGHQKFVYDIWGKTVNTASRIESAASSGAIELSEETFSLLKGRIKCRKRSRSIKDLGNITTYQVSTSSIYGLSFSKEEQRLAKLRYVNLTQRSQ